MYIYGCRNKCKVYTEPNLDKGKGVFGMLVGALRTNERKIHNILG